VSGLLSEETVVKKILCVSVLAMAVVATASTNASAQGDNPLRAGAQRTFGIVSTTATS
jgi:uncharacterized protein YraI